MPAPPDAWKESEIRSLLLEVTRELGTHDPDAQVPARLAGSPAGRLIDRAIHHNVARALHSAPCTADLAPLDRERLHAHCVGGVINQMRTTAELPVVAQTLREADVPWLLVKGPVVADVLYTRPDLRAYVDLDVLVPASHFSEAVERLEAAGARLIDANWPLLLADMRGQVKFFF